ncbi:MAG: TonB-dependent receptor plug domain-containing protein [Draconibacterium sp.]
MKAFKSLILLLILFVVEGFSVLSAQNRTISGKVFDTQQEALVGVTIQLSGTTQGTVTAADGSFSLLVPSEAVVLNISYVGYLTQKVNVAPDQNDIKVYMQEDVILMNEMVVVGYGTQKKVNLTGAVTTVESKRLENRVSHSLTNMLQGSVPGLNITTSSGVPGSSPNINIRGVTSINGASPLVLIDGAVGDLNRVNPNDVESISVIKDASAAAVYGARAAFGVILVTTKSGSAQDNKATVRYSGRYGWERSPS